ncbi:MAG: hypothetical protein GY946_15535, partial [bacterium]|nr:hypothetical protein [bacterium]
MHPTIRSFGLAWLVAAACGGDANKSGSGSIAKALAYESEERAAADAASQARNDEIAAKKKAEKDAEATLTADIEKVISLPAKLPSDIKAAC